MNNEYTNSPYHTQNAEYETPPKISNFLIPSILVTIFCCLPLGIPAIIFASQVNIYVQHGAYAEAREASKKAKIFTWLSFGIMFAFYLIYIGIIVSVVIMENS